MEKLTQLFSEVARNREFVIMESRVQYMTVNEARPRTDRPRTGGGGGGRGGFGGGRGRY